MKIGIIGYYGHNNLGDELNLKEVIKLLLQQYPQADIIAFSGGFRYKFVEVDYRLVMADYLGLLGYRDALNQMDVIIIGGGGLVFLGANYFDFLMEDIKVPYIFSRIGIDNRIVNESVCRELSAILKRAADVTVRTSYDQQAADILLSLHCQVVPEAIWNYQAPLERLDNDFKSILVAVNAYASDYCAPLRNALTGLPHSYQIFMSSMQDTANDFYFNLLSCPDRVNIIPDVVGIERKAGFLAAADIVIASRLHAGVIALSHGVPALMLPSTPKVKYLLRELELTDLYYQGQDMAAWIEHILAHRRHWSDDIKLKIEPMKAGARQAIVP